MYWLSRAAFGFVFALLVVTEFACSAPTDRYVQKLASIQKLCPSSDLMCPSAAKRVSPGTPKETKALSGSQAKAASIALKESLKNQTSVMVSLGSNTKKIAAAELKLANAVSEIERLNVATAKTLKDAKTAEKKFSDLCSRVVWSYLDSPKIDKYCVKGAGGNKCRREVARVRKAKGLCVVTLPALKLNLKTYHARRLGEISRLQRRGDKRRAARGKRKAKKTQTKQRRDARKEAEKIDENALDALVKGNRQAQAEIAKLAEQKEKAATDKKNQKNLQTDLEQLKDKLTKQKKKQSSCTIDLGAQPAIAKFSIPARSKGNQARRQLLGERQRRGRAQRRRARRRRAQRRGASSVQKKGPKKGKRQQRRRAQRRRASSVQKKGPKKGNRQQRRTAQRRRASSVQKKGPKKGKRQQRRTAQKKNVEAIGLCVLDKGGKLPRSNVNLYCASTTQPTLKAEEVRACQTKGGGVVLVKHRKNERVTTTDATGKESTLLVDYIKVSACGQGKSDNVQCTVKKILYKCRMVKKGVSRECGIAEKRIAIANV